MANDFPRKSLPTASADTLSLIRHISEADPHPGRYIKIDGNTLDLEHPTLFNSYQEFQKMPSYDTLLGYSPRLVIFTGAEQRDPITGVIYQNLHPYIYEGAVVTVGDQKYPVWVDKIDTLTTKAFTDMKALLYQHETDTGTSTTSVHPTLARKDHTHHYSTIGNFTEGVFEVSKGVYAYSVSNETELNNRRIDGALIIYIGEQYEYSPGRYVAHGHMYRYDADNFLWIDVTAIADVYTKSEMDAMIVKHNNNAGPWAHTSLALLGHSHIAADVTDFDDRVIALVGSQSTSAIEAHNVSPSAHSALFSAKADVSVVDAHTTDTTIHMSAGERAAWSSGSAMASSVSSGFTQHSGNSDIHITSAERTDWNNKLDVDHNSDVDAHGDGFAHTLIVKNDWPVFQGITTYVSHTYRPAIGSSQDIGDFSIYFSDKLDAPPAIFGCDVDHSGVYAYMHVLNSVAQSSGLSTYKSDLRIRLNDNGTAYITTDATLSGVMASTEPIATSNDLIATTKFVHDYVVAQGSGVQSVNSIPPTSGNVTLVGSAIPYASAGDANNVFGVISSHIASNVHITAAERVTWSSAYTTAITASSTASAASVTANAASSGLTGKANSSHTHSSGDVSGLSDVLTQMGTHCATTSAHVSTDDRTSWNAVSGKLGAPDWGNRTLTDNIAALTSNVTVYDMAGGSDVLSSGWIINTYSATSTCWVFITATGHDNVHVKYYVDNQQVSSTYHDYDNVTGVLLAIGSGSVVRVRNDELTTENGKVHIYQMNCK